MFSHQNQNLKKKKNSRNTSNCCKSELSTLFSEQKFRETKTAFQWNSIFNTYLDVVLFLFNPSWSCFIRILIEFLFPVYSNHTFSELTNEWIFQERKLFTKCFEPHFLPQSFSPDINSRKCKMQTKHQQLNRRQFQTEKKLIKNRVRP